MPTTSVSALNNQKTLDEIIKSTTEKNNRNTTGELGKFDFLNLLVTQLRYQDPLQPMEDKEFIGQIAQFSALEQMQNLNTSFSAVKAFSLMGKRITANIVDEETQEVETVEGEVTNVKISNGVAYVVVRGQDVPIDSITEVAEGYWSSESNISTYTNLIGFNVYGAVYDSKTGHIVGVNGIVKAIDRGLYEDYAVMDGVRVEIAEIVTDNPSADPDFIENYLEEHEGGEYVEVVIVDRQSGYKVPVVAKLREYSIVDGEITAILDELSVPVDSIVKIAPADSGSDTVE